MDAGIAPIHALLDNPDSAEFFIITRVFNFSCAMKAKQTKKELDHNILLLIICLLFWRTEMGENQKLALIQILYK